MMFRTLLLLLLLVAATASGQGVPYYMSYQGVLTDTNGAPLADDDYSVTVRLYENSTSSLPPVWEDTKTVTVSDGVFSTLLGYPSGAFTDPTLFDRALWMTLEVDGGGETLPRTPLSTVPYAFMAGGVDDGVAVRSVNGLEDDLILSAGPGIEIIDNGTNEIVVSSTGGGGGPGMIWDYQGNSIMPLVPAEALWSPGVLIVQDQGQSGGIMLDSRIDGNLGATMVFYGETGLPGVQVHGQRNAADNGGLIELYDDTFVRTVRIEGESSIGQEGGGRLSLYQDNGTETLRLAAQEDGLADQGGMIRLYDENGNATVELDGDYGGQGRVITDALEITGGADLSEQFDISSVGQAVQPGHVVCIDPDRPGELMLSGQAYDTRVAGVVSGAGGVRPGMLMGQRGSEADGAHPVALTGRVYVQVDAAGGAVVPGDLLTTSNVPGHAMKVGDPGQAQGAILGKAMTGLEGGRGLVLVLVTLQ